MKRLRSYDPGGGGGGGAIPDGSITTAKLGGDITTLAKTLLQQSTEKEVRTTIEVAESATYSTGPLGL